MHPLQRLTQWWRKVSRTTTVPSTSFRRPRFETIADFVDRCFAIRNDAPSDCGFTSHDLRWLQVEGWVVVVVVVVMVDRAIYMHWGLIGEVFMSSMDLVVC